MTGLEHELGMQQATDERLLDDMIIVANAASRGVALRWLARTVVSRLEGRDRVDWRGR